MAPGQQFRRGMHPDQGQYMAQPWSPDDDKLLYCLMTEFSENMGLVADVYISTRRSEGLYFEVATTMERIRNIAKVRFFPPRTAFVSPCTACVPAATCPIVGADRALVPSA